MQIRAADFEALLLERRRIAADVLAGRHVQVHVLIRVCSRFINGDGTREPAVVACHDNLSGLIGGRRFMRVPNRPRTRHDHRIRLHLVRIICKRVEYRRCRVRCVNPRRTADPPGFAEVGCFVSGKIEINFGRIFHHEIRNRRVYPHDLDGAVERHGGIGVLRQHELSLVDIAVIHVKSVAIWNNVVDLLGGCFGRPCSGNSVGILPSVRISVVAVIVTGLDERPALGDGLRERRRRDAERDHGKRETFADATERVPPDCAAAHCATSVAERSG